VNLIGKSSLKMADLKAIAGDLGLENARTYIASGNLLFKSNKPEEALRRALEKDLQKHMGKEVRVMLRTADEMAKVVKANPFTDQPGNNVQAFFLNQAPPKDLLDTCATRPATSASRRARARSLSRTAKGVSASRGYGFRRRKPAPRAT
jgi:uncharacterized protein (DUF1697 family)